jgi:hypothetical protein
METGLALTIAFGFIAIIGLILTCVFYQKSRRITETSWSIRTNNIVSGFTAKLEALQILYSGARVENISISKILFWNSGTETINRQDITTADPLRIVAIREIHLLDVKVQQVNNKPSQFSADLAPDQKSANLGFDYFDRGQGAVIQVIHTGTSSADIQVAGAIKSAGGPKKRIIKVVQYLPLPTSKAFDQRLSPNTRKVVRALFVVIPLIGFGLVFLITPLVSTPDKPLSGDEWFSVGYGCFALAAGVGWIAINLLRDRIPKGLQAYTEEI